MAVVAALRFVLAPVFGITQGPVERIVSITTVVLVSLVVYGVLLGVRDGRIGDVPVVALGLALSMTVLIAMALAASAALGADNAYLDPAHLGRNPDVLEHILAHVRVLPLLTVIATVLCGVVFGVARLGKYVRGRVTATA